MTVKTFIERPVLSIVISAGILLLGFIALMRLPVEQFPNIAPPTVEVTTSYPGANAETVEKSVIVPLEEAINGVENMTYIHIYRRHHRTPVMLISPFISNRVPIRTWLPSTYRTEYRQQRVCGLPKSRK